MALRGRVACRIVAAAFAVGVVGVVATGPFQPADAADTTTLLPTTEAWYQPDPTCAAALGCGASSPLASVPPAPSVSPYPRGTLHVGYALGRETARTYLGFALPDPTQTTAAALDIPLDTSAADGSSQPDRAKIQVCAVSAEIAEVDGAMAAPPALDCAHAVPISYVATPAPHLHADVGSLLASSSAASGLALLPSAADVDATASWRVVFSAHDRTDAGKTPAASLALTIGDAPVDTAPIDSSALGPSALGPSALGDLALAGLGAANLPAAPPTVERAAERPVALQPTRAPSPVASVVDRYAYAIVWLLPLVLLVGFHQAATLLTRDLRPRATRC